VEFFFRLFFVCAEIAFSFRPESGVPLPCVLVGQCKDPVYGAFFLYRSLKQNLFDVNIYMFFLLNIKVDLIRLHFRKWCGTVKWCSLPCSPSLGHSPVTVSLPFWHVAQMSDEADARRFLTASSWTTGGDHRECLLTWFKTTQQDLK